MITDLFLNLACPWPAKERIRIQNPAYRFAVNEFRASFWMLFSFGRYPFPK
jgi:hypothetical protein